MAGKATTRKTNAATEVVLGQGAQLISKAVADLKTASELVITKMEEKSTELSLQITNKTEQIETLDVEYTEKLRQKEVELALKFKENTESVVNGYLLSSGKVSIKSTELAEIKKELETTKANVEKEVSTAVAIMKNTLTSNHEAAMKLKEAEHKTSTIENESKIKTLEEKNTFLASQVDKLYAQLDAERAASIERTKASAVGTIQVNGASK